MSDNRYIYVWCLFSDDGYYMEPDISLIKIFFLKKDLLKYMKKIENKHRYLFYQKRRINLLDI